MIDMSQTLDELDNGRDAHSVDAVLKAIHTNVNVRVSCYNVCVVTKYCNFDCHFLTVLLEHIF